MFDFFQTKDVTLAVDDAEPATLKLVFYFSEDFSFFDMNRQLFSANALNFHAAKKLNRRVVFFILIRLSLKTMTRL